MKIPNLDYNFLSLSGNLQHPQPNLGGINLVEGLDILGQIELELDIFKGKFLTKLGSLNIVIV